MKRLLFLSLIFALALMLVACDSGNTGDFKITLRLPVDLLEDCDSDDESDDHTFCIVETDQVLLSTYSTSDISEEYVYADRKLITVGGEEGVGDNKSGKVDFTRSLKKGNYYRFFVEVTNKNEKLKLTGGIDGILYDDGENYDVDIFLAPVGDFARVVSDRTRSGDTALESYFGDGGSKGAAAVALKDGTIYMAGGYVLNEEIATRKAVIFNTKKLSKKEVKKLDLPLYDHVAALLDDGSEKGKVVIGLGKIKESEDEDEFLNEKVWIYNPESDKYSEISDVTFSPMSGAKAISVGGDVYIIGGCGTDGASNNVYKIAVDSEGKLTAAHFATLKQGRCNHAVADFSTFTVDADKNTVPVPRILVIGGSTNNAKEGKETPVIGDNFAEIIDLESGSVKSIAIADRNGSDDASLKTTGLISPASATVLMDDKEDTETVVSILGGYIREGEDDSASWMNNGNLFIFSEGTLKVQGEDDKETTKAVLFYDYNGSPFECSRPAAAFLGSEEKSTFKYVAVNCGNKDVERKKDTEQIVFVVQVKRVKDSDLGQEVFSSSVRESLMEENQDPEGDGKIMDGPVAADGLGQVFMLGGQYLYQVGSYAVP